MPNRPTGSAIGATEPVGRASTGGRGGWEQQQQQQQQPNSSHAQHTQTSRPAPGCQGGIPTWLTTELWAINAVYPGMRAADPLFVRPAGNRLSFSAPCGVYCLTFLEGHQYADEKAREILPFCLCSWGDYPAVCLAVFVVSLRLHTHSIAPSRALALSPSHTRNTDTMAALCHLIILPSQPSSQPDEPAHPPFPLTTPAQRPVIRRHKPRGPAACLSACPPSYSGGGGSRRVC